jgi:PKHD-type hydroxylase
MLIIIDNILSPNQLKVARSLLSNGFWGSGLATAGIQAAQVKCNQQISEEDERLPVLRRLVLDALNQSAIFFSAALPLKVLPPFFNRYTGATNYYGQHVDCAMRLAPNSVGGYVRSDLSATLFLSNPDEYEGGILQIEDTFGTHDIKLKAGSLVLYPSSSIHEVTAVTSGSRVACFMFIQSMVREEEKRRLLYEMDMSLLSLRQNFSDLPEIVKLTGVYHNLLRQWADC